MSEINQNININVQSSFSSYDSLLKKLDSLKAKFGDVSKVNPTKRLTAYLNSLKDPISEINNILDKLSSKIKSTQAKIDTNKSLGLPTASLNAELKRYELQQKRIYAYTQKNPQLLKQTETSWFRIYRSINNARSGIQKVFKTTQKFENSTKKSATWLSKLIGRIRNISIYRTIRRGLQIVFQTITQGFERVTKLNKEAEQSARRLKADYNLIATAVGVTVTTLLNSFIGDIDKFTDKLLEYINAFNKALAITSGQTKYLKVVRDEIYEINKETSKLSFDKFEALSQRDETLSGVRIDPTEILPEEKLTKTENNMLSFISTIKKAFDAVKPILIQLYEVLKDIFTKVIMPIINSGAVGFIIDIVGGLIDVLDKLGLLKTAIISIIALKVLWNIGQIGVSIYSLLPTLTKLWYQLTAVIIPAINSFIASIGRFVVDGVKKFASGISNMLSNAKNMKMAITGLSSALAILGAFTLADTILGSLEGQGKQIASIIFIIVGAVTALAVAIMAMQGALTLGTAIPLIMAGIGVGIAGIKGAVESAKEISGYATGGIPEKSELFYMNEYGRPEALVNTGGNQTNVININQLSEGMKRGFVQAIYETGLLDAMQTRIIVEGDNVNDNAFARAIFPALKTESRRRGGDQL